MSHTARYSIEIACASREIAESVLDWMHEKGLIGKVQKFPYGLFFSLKNDYHSIKVDVQKGKITFSGESYIVDGKTFHETQKMFNDVYTAMVYRIALQQQGYKTNMTLTEQKGKKVIDIVGVN